MRKIAFVLTVLLAATAPAFSQVRLASWGRLVWLPYFIDQGDKPRSLIEAPWGDEPDMEFMITAANANFGIDVGLLIEKGSLERGNVSQIANMKAWWSPNRYFKLHIGSGRVSPMRGQIYGSTGMYAYARGQLTGLTARSGDNEPIVKIDDGDGIFSRINLGRLGAIAELTPLPGLYIAAAVMPEYNGDKGNFAQDVYKGVQAVAGYTFGGIGLARIGYIGGGRGSDGIIANTARNSDFSLDRRIEAAFAPKFIPNMQMDIGMKYSLEKHPGTLTERTGFCLENPLYIAMGLMYIGVTDLRLGFVMDGHFAGTANIKNKLTKGDTVTSAPQIAFNLYPTYSLGFAEVGGDFTYGAQFGHEKGVNDKQMLGFGAHIQKTYGGNSIRAGIYANAPMDKGQKWGMSIPIWITYQF